MKNYLKSITVALAAFFAFAVLPGCEIVQGALYQEKSISQTGTLPVDAVEVSPGKFVAVSDLTPGTYSPQQVIPAGTEVTVSSVEMIPTQAVETIIDVASGLAGPYGGLAGVLASGLLAIFGTVQSKRLSKSQRTEKALVQGIDVFRDVLDQTPQGEKIDAALKEALKERQAALQVVDRVNDLLARYKTPTKTSTKTPIQLQ